MAFTVNEPGHVAEHNRLATAVPETTPAGKFLRDDGTWADGTVSDAGVAALIPDTGTATGAAIAEAIVAQGGESFVVTRFNLLAYGGKRDVVIVSDAAMTSGSAVLTTAHVFDSSDVGKVVGVFGAGPNGGPTYSTVMNDGWLVTTIAAVSGGVATLATPASATVSGAKAKWGTNNDAALVTALDDAKVHGGTVYIPAGDWLFSAQLAWAANVSLAGAARLETTLHIVKDANGDTGNTFWLLAGGIADVWVRDFTVECEAMVDSGAGYTSGHKPLGFYSITDGGAVGIGVLNSPATAIPFDEGKGQSLIAFNYIYNPGRFSPAMVGPGGSGIGVGLTDAACHGLIIGNTVEGKWSITGGYGNCGIFVEAEGGIATPLASATMPVGYRIIGNYVRNMAIGIEDAGGLGTIIADNVVDRCNKGIRIAPGTVVESFLGWATKVHHNVVARCTGPGNVFGIEITSALTAGSANNLIGKVEADIHDNTIFGGSSFGMHIINAFTHSVANLDGISIRDNRIFENKSGGIIIAATGGATGFTNMRIEGNTLYRNTGAAITINSGTTVTGRLFNNHAYDDQGTPTQTSSFNASGATITGLAYANNTGQSGWPS